MKTKKEGCIRVCSLEVSGLKPDDYKRWQALLDVCRDVTNCIWQTWLLWHVQHGSRAKQKAFLAEHAAWKNGGKETRGEKPKSPVDAVPKECQKLIYDTVTAEFPSLHMRPVVLLMNSVIGKIKSRKAAHGSLPGWVSILLFNESMPSTVRKNPIPFDKANAAIEPPDPADESGQWKMRLRIDRIDQPGKKTATSTLDVVHLWSKGRKAAGQVAILRKIATGEYDFCGSNMIYSESKRKWFAAICYRAPRPEPAEVDTDKTAFLRPVAACAVKPHPWKLRVPRSNRWPGGLGEYIGAVRRKIAIERISRQNQYRHAGTANKGHGRDRALKPIWQLQQRWKDFVKTCNYQVAKDVVQQCVARGIGTLVYFQPGGKVRDGRFLTSAGKREEVRESTGWDWYQIGKRLELLCEEAGIAFDWRKPKDERREVVENPPVQAVGKTTHRKPDRNPKRSAGLRSRG